MIENFCEEMNPKGVHVRYSYHEIRVRIPFNTEIHDTFKSLDGVYYKHWWHFNSDHTITILSLLKEIYGYDPVKKEAPLVRAKSIKY